MLKNTQNQYYGLRSKLPSKLKQGASYVAVDTSEYFIYSDEERPVQISPSVDPIIYSKGANVPNPVPGYEKTLFYTKTELIVSEGISYLTAGTSVKYRIVRRSSRNTGFAVTVLNPLTISFGGQPDPVDLGDEVIPANSWVVLSIEAVVGPVTDFHTSLMYTKTP